MPEIYPDAWMFVHDFGLQDHAFIGKVMVLDLASANANYKGDVQAARYANFVESKTRKELYVSETAYSRTTYGERTDLIVVYGKEDLSPNAEIVLPGTKRALMPAHKEMFTLTGDERFALVYNFTPAASVTVVDMEQRKVLNEVATPGCSMIYPIGRRSFGSLCADGTMVALRLNDQGQPEKETITRKFNDIDNDPLFMSSVAINDVRYFLSFHGQIQPIDISSDKPKALPPWSLLSAVDMSESWRPSGWQVITADAAGRIYILARKGAVDGEHNIGGKEVWVYDVTSKKRINRISLKTSGYSIEVTRGVEPLLAVANEGGEIDVYKTDNGQFLRTIGGWRNATPLVLHAVK